MIPLKYREILPPYWYENHVAMFHFEGAGNETDYQKAVIQELGKQFALPYATYSLDVWEWIFFGGKEKDYVGILDVSLYFDGQANFDGSYLFSGLSTIQKDEPDPEPEPEVPQTVEERRMAIRMKFSGKSKFTLRNLTLIGKKAGTLDRVVEDFEKGQLHFRFKPGPIQTSKLIKDVQRVRPVHVSREASVKLQTWDHLELLTWDEVEEMTWDEIENTTVVVF